MKNHQFDLVIIGGGPTGAALALLLAKFATDPARIALFHTEEAGRYGYPAKLDPRVIAINEGSRVLLTDLASWPVHVQPITQVHVSQSGRLGRTVIDPKDFNVQALGYIVRYAELHALLLEHAKQSGITVLIGHPASLVDRTQQPDATHDYPVTITQDNEVYEARLVVQADGMHHANPIETERSSHPKQVALLGSATASYPKPGWAFERFTRNGPLAVLPHPEGVQTQSIVWCCSPEQAKSIKSMSLADASVALTHAFGERLGTLHLTQTLKSFNLYQSRHPTPVLGRLVAIGNAAQTLHPVAGQGLNLGLRDAATLTHCLRDWVATPTRPPEKALEIYDRLRQNDRRLTSELTSFMSDIFTTGLAPVEHAAGLTLLALDTLPWLRAPLARQLMQGLRQ